MKLNTSIIKDFDTLDADGLRAAIVALDLPDGKAELEMLKTAYQRTSNALDKASSDLAKLKKQIAATLPADETASHEDEARFNSIRGEVAQLKKENQINKLKARFVLLGYDEASAEQAAIYQCSGDSDALFSIMGEQNKRIEVDMKAALLKQTPRPDGAGVDNDKPGLPGNIKQAQAFGEKKAESLKEADTLKYYL